MLRKGSFISNIKLGDNVFENVNLPTALLFISVSINHKKRVEFSDVSKNSVDTKLNNIQFEQIEIIENSFNFVQKVQQKNSENLIKLIDIYDQVMGVKIYQIGKGKPKQTSFEVDNDVFVSPEKLDDSYWFFIDSGVKRYDLVQKEKKFIKYGEWLAEPRKLHYFTNDKIVIREVVNPRIFSCFIDFPAIIKNTNAVIIQKNPEYSLKFLLGILNSNYFDSYLKKEASKINNSSFPSINSQLLKNFLIPKTLPEAQKPFELLVNQILTKKKEGEDTSALEAEIDSLVYGLYDLTEAEIAVVEGR